MKKVLAAVLAALICISLCGCKQKTHEEFWQEQLEKADTTELEKQIENAGGLKKYSFPE